MKYYAVIDTNVLVSAAIKWDSVPGAILSLAFEGTIVPLLNKEIVDEYTSVLSRPKFHVGADKIDSFIHQITSIGIMIDRLPIEIDLPDPKDKVFYEIVMAKREDDDAYLVTGNIKHFPVEPFIVTPRQMLDIIFGDKTDELSSN